MASQNVRFRVNRPGVIHENVDGEVIIVNLDTGSYYSVDAVGARVWDVLSEGATLEEAGELLASDYGVAPGVITETIAPFAQELASEALLVPIDDGERQPAGAAAAASAPKGPFAPPRLNKYTDMQDLLLLDPIHDVDEAGWPAPARRSPDDDPAG